MARKDMKGDKVGLGDLPQNCIATILSLTSPTDVSLLAAVSRSFNSAAESDTAWERFLPPDYRKILQWAVEPLDLRLLSKKDIFQQLSTDPVLIRRGELSFGLQRSTGKKCYALSAREIYICCSHNPQYGWRWVSLPTQESRFPEVAELLSVVCLMISGVFVMKELSPLTTYSIYLVFKLTEDSYGLDVPCETRIAVAGLVQITGTVYLQHSDPQQHRKDGWMEVLLGEFFNDCADPTEVVEMGLYEEKLPSRKSGLIVQGIEIRPK